MTHMRRSLLAVRRLIDNSNDDLERVCGALKGYSLRFALNLVSYFCLWKNSGEKYLGLSKSNLITLNHIFFVASLP